MSTIDPAAQEEMQKYEKLQEEQYRSDLKTVMETPQGRRVLYRVVFQLAAVESLSYTGSSEQTFFREGRRDVGISLMRELQDELPEQYLTMLSEAVLEAAKQTQRIKRIKEDANARADGPGNDD
jgi:hypothetical protein